MNFFSSSVFPGAPVCNGNWTSFHNGDDPSGSGDQETLTDFLFKNPNQTCENSVAVDARVVGNHTHYTQTGQVIKINRNRNQFQCLNNQQRNGEQCLDYEARFCCSA